MLRASNQMNDFLESGRASRGGEGRESPQSSRKCLAKALSASSVSGGGIRHISLGISLKAYLKIFFCSNIRRFENVLIFIALILWNYLHRTRNIFL